MADTSPQSPQSPSLKQYYNVLQLIFFSLFGGQIIFGLMCFFLSLDGSINSGQDDLVTIMTYVVPTLSVSLIIGSRLIFNLWIRKATQDSMIEQFKVYQSASIVRWAMIEGGTLLSLVIFLLSGTHFFLYCALFCLYFFFSHKPKVSQISEDLSWNSQQIEEFEAEIAQ